MLHHKHNTQERDRVVLVFFFSSQKKNDLENEKIEDTHTQYIGNRLSSHLLSHNITETEQPNNPLGASQSPTFTSSYKQILSGNIIISV